MKRNENANCGNCPYWKRTAMGWWDDGLLFGWCRYWPSKIKKRDTEWCGQHPDFWETEVVQAAPKCEPTQEALEEIARLLNDGEHAEALKALRRMHGLKFVCTNCGDISSSTGPGFVCRECGGYLTTRVVAAKETGQ